MSGWSWLGLAALALLALWAAAAVALLLAGRRTDARALAGFVPDCAVLFGRLLRDRRVPMRRRIALALVVGYLAVPIDVVPDFVPVLGQLDDAVLVALALRALLRGGGRALVEDHWPGPRRSLDAVLRLGGLRAG